MPFVQNQGARIYWNSEGNGPPVLLIMGLGCTSDLWHRLQPVLARRYRTICFDNRGVGRSDIPPGPYAMELMASDAAAVLDAAAVDRAHIFGMSMGGMIAQEFALQYPNRVRSLILGCTSPGGPQSVKAEPAARDMLMGRGSMTPEAAAEASIPFIHDPGTPRARIDEDMAVRRQWFASVPGYMAQLQGIIAWQALDRLPQIHVPTLIIHGQSDRLIPPQNAELIAAHIPACQLVLLPAAGHMFATDQPEAAQRAILDFLASQPASERHNEHQAAS